MSIIEYIYLDVFIKDLNKLPKNLLKIALKKIEKIKSGNPRKHLKYGLPYFVERISKSSRIIYKVDLDNNQIIFVRCFATHKEYEKWYNSWK